MNVYMRVMDCEACRETGIGSNTPGDINTNPQRDSWEWTTCIACQGKGFITTKYELDDIFISLQEAESDIKALIDGMLRGESLQRSQELNALAEEVVRKVEAEKRASDITAWARRLANDVAHLTD